MNVRYFGKQAKIDWLTGEKTGKYFQPVAIVSYTDEEELLAISRIEATGYRFDSFDNCSYVYVSDRDDYNDFMVEWKKAKKNIVDSVTEV